MAKAGAPKPRTERNRIIVRTPGPGMLCQRNREAEIPSLQGITEQHASKRASKILSRRPPTYFSRSNDSATSRGIRTRGAVPIFRRLSASHPAGSLRARFAKVPVDPVSQRAR
jgi:hypothetical protein